MLAGCSSSTLLSPRHRLRSESSSAAQFQACHFPIPPSSMSTQRLDLPCNFSRKDTARSRSQPIRPVGISVEKPIESKNSIKQNIRLPPLATSGGQNTYVEGKSLKRFAEQSSVDDKNRAKRNRGCGRIVKSDEAEQGNGSFWFQQNFSGLPFSLTCSGEEERICFVPPSPSLKNPWVDSVITEFTNFGEKSLESSQRPVKEASGSSSTSSDSQSSGRQLIDTASGQERGNGSGNPHPIETRGVETGEEQDNQRENQGFELISLLTACVEAIGCKNIAAIHHFIAELGRIASPKGTPLSRLTAYYTEALALRVTRLWPNVFHIATPRELERAEDDSGTALRLLNQVTPIPKFIHFTSNEILLRAFEGKDRVHIIDFDIKQGLQWPSLFQSLASRTNPPSHIRITGIGELKQELNETGDRLAEFAEALNLPFEFHPVVDRLEDVRLWMLHVKEKECVAVNCMFQLHKLLYDENGGAIRDFLGLIRSTNPTIVVMAEQEAEHNTPNLEARFSNSLKYYSALFDSVDYTLPLDSPVRIKIEETFAREIRNIIACEGSHRFERHERFEKWKKIMEEGGFRSAGIRERETLQSQMLLKMYSCENYSVGDSREDDNNDDAMRITLNWMDQPLYTVSAWSLIDVAGCSSSI